MAYEFNYNAGGFGPNNAPDYKDYNHCIPDPDLRPIDPNHGIPDPELRLIDPDCDTYTFEGPKPGRPDMDNMPAKGYVWFKRHIDNQPGDIAPRRRGR